MASIRVRLINSGIVSIPETTEAQLEAEISAAIVRGDDFIEFTGDYAINGEVLESGLLKIVMSSILLIYIEP